MILAQELVLANLAAFIVVSNNGQEKPLATFVNKPPVTFPNKPQVASQNKQHRGQM